MTMFRIGWQHETQAEKCNRTKQRSFSHHALPTFGTSLYGRS